MSGFDTGVIAVGALHRLGGGIAGHAIGPGMRGRPVVLDGRGVHEAHCGYQARLVNGRSQRSERSAAW
ncbi:MAG TPA: hypothetical protein VGM42_10050 [Rhodopila sp.]